MSNDSIINNLVSFNSNEQFLTTSLNVENKEKGWIFKYTLLQTIKKALGFYDTATIGKKLTGLIKDLTATEKDNLETVIINIINLSDKIAGKNPENNSRYHSHFEKFFLELAKPNTLARTLILDKTAPFRGRKITPERLNEDLSLEHEIRKTKRIVARREATGRPETTSDESLSKTFKSKIKRVEQEESPIEFYKQIRAENAKSIQPPADPNPFEEVEKEAQIAEQDQIGEIQLGTRQEAYAAKTLPVDQRENFITEQQQNERQILEEESDALIADARLKKYAESQNLSPEETAKLLEEQQKKEKAILWSEKEAQDKENAVSTWSKIGSKLRSIFN
jgi:hypothetical protein